MTAQILDGRAVANTMSAEIASEVAEFVEARGYAPGIAVVQAGDDAASSWYVRQISRSFTRAGMRFEHVALEETATEREFVAALTTLNQDRHTNGIIVQMPLPAQLPQSLLTQILDPEKDVDGIHPVNAGRLMQGDPEAFVPATPAGGMELLRRYGIGLSGKHAVMVGRSNIVGRPMALLMLHQHATVTICHSRTPDLCAVARQGDVLVAAVGKAKIITAEMIKPGAVVIDFGVNPVGKEMVGDVDTDAAMDVAGHITPVPGGTGPMTNVMLMANTLIAARRQSQRPEGASRL
jgi:methylenetetrahydrofolate dehydrogenase (NADP+) / methenyltetrahydrofolate cyclohydrolase